MSHEHIDCGSGSCIGTLIGRRLAAADSAGKETAAPEPIALPSLRLADIGQNTVKDRYRRMHTFWAQLPAEAPLLMVKGRLRFACPSRVPGRWESADRPYVRRALRTLCRQTWPWLRLRAAYVLSDTDDERTLRSARLLDPE